MNKPDKRERFSVERFQKSDNERLQNWQIAFRKLSTGNDLVWGIGPKNYSSIDPGELGIESEFYKRTGKLNHAHNLFLTQWVEQGLMGLAAMLIFFGLIVRRLKKCWPYCKETERQWVWLAGLGGLVVPVMAGFFNTPFYQEHAMLAMILMGAMYSETENVA
jgi:O-antigen ligase